MKGGGGELLLAVKMARKGFRGSKTKIALSTMNNSNDTHENSMWQANYHLTNLG